VAVRNSTRRSTIPTNSVLPAPSGDADTDLTAAVGHRGRQHPVYSDGRRQKSDHRKHSQEASLKTRLGDCIGDHLLHRPDECGARLPSAAWSAGCIIVATARGSASVRTINVIRVRKNGCDTCKYGWYKIAGGGMAAVLVLQLIVKRTSRTQARWRRARAGGSRLEIQRPQAGVLRGDPATRRRIDAWLRARPSP
jgi:hypothetical protein